VKDKVGHLIISGISLLSLKTMWALSLGSNDFAVY